MKLVCNLRELLKREGKSMNWLAKIAGASSRSQAQRWCSGEIPHPGYLLRISKETGWTLEEMLEEIVES